MARAYPRLSRRIYAAAIDGIVFLAGICIVLLGVGPLEPRPWILVALIAVVFLIEPVLVSTTAGSIGHHFLGINILNRRSGQKIGILPAIARTVTRGVFGLFSLLFINTTKEYRALHDILTGSIVVLRDPASMPTGTVLSDRKIESSDFVYPSLWRRGGLIFIYAVLAYIITTVLIIFLLPETCFSFGPCTDGENALMLVLSLSFWVVVGILMVQGVKGRLAGARRYPRSEGPTD